MALEVGENMREVEASGSLRELSADEMLVVAGGYSFGDWFDLSGGFTLDWRYFGYDSVRSLLDRWYC